MTILCDRDIAARLDYDPAVSLIAPLPAPNARQPASVDLMLGKNFLLPFHRQQGLVEVNIRDRNVDYFPVELDTLVLEPGQFVLGETIETVNIPHDLVGRVDGKSSLGRIGLIVHCTAGFLDPGFKGAITLEILNVARYPIRLVPGAYVCQVNFTLLSAPPDRPYGHPELKSRYQGQPGVTGAK